jgi:tRNA(Ile)-lysidine synthase
VGLPDELLARCRFPPSGTAVTCAVSGGADSLALLVLAVRAGCGVTAVHVDHGLRPGSAAEADVVAAAAERYSAAFRAVSVDVAPGPNLEARARAARRAVLPGDALLGHTADDRAETVVLHLLRGAGPAGAVGIARDGRRPLLDLRRADTRALCAHEGLVPLDDPMNDDPAFTRVRVRHEVLPLLTAVAGRDLVPVLCRQGDLAADVVAALDEATAALLNGPHDGPHDGSLDARAIAAASPALARWALRRWLVERLGAEHPPDAAALDRVRSVAAGVHVATEIGGGHRVRRHAQRLWVDAAS